MTTQEYIEAVNDKLRIVYPESKCMFLIVGRAFRILTIGERPSTLAQETLVKSLNMIIGCDMRIDRYQEEEEGISINHIDNGVMDRFLEADDIVYIIPKVGKVYVTTKDFRVEGINIAKGSSLTYVDVGRGVNHIDTFINLATLELLTHCRENVSPITAYEVVGAETRPLKDISVGDKVTYANKTMFVTATENIFGFIRATLTDGEESITVMLVEDYIGLEVIEKADTSHFIDNKTLRYMVRVTVGETYDPRLDPIDTLENIIQCTDREKTISRIVEEERVTSEAIGRIDYFKDAIKATEDLTSILVLPVIKLGTGTANSRIRNMEINIASSEYRVKVYQTILDAPVIMEKYKAVKVILDKKIAELK